MEVVTTKSEKKREWRIANPELYEKEKQASVAYKRAERRLGRLFPDELEMLVDEERQKLGLLPIGASRIGRPSKRTILQECIEGKS